ncbi:MAG: hypothetical protein MMC33_001309 [Icmadophila ericetorum]|nr:hypothetical protein [Icmadophila ericetorum]
MKEGFVHRFVDNGDLFNALRVFRLIPRSFFLLNYTEQHVCVRILRLKLQVENLYATRSAILTEMLERGIRPNRFMVNVIMTNAVEGEDYNTVWKVHALTAGNGMKPDDITYDLLLRVARDMETVENIRKEASEAGIFPKVPRLVATYLVSVFKLAQAQDSDSMVFDLLLPTYREFFDILPLNDLLGLRLDQDEGARNWEVNHVALGIMILAYLRQTRHGRDTHQIYQNYMKLIQTGHPVWLELAKTDHTANAFVWALGQRADTLHLCISVLEDMIKYSASLGVMPPKEMTWSMLLNNFLYHGQISAAERVLSIMKARGVETQQMTWSNIVAAYARTQDVGAAVDALIRLEKNGFSIDERTIKALGLIHDRERLREALEAVSQKPSTDGNVSKLSSADDTSVYQAVGAV